MVRLWGNSKMNNNRKLQWITVASISVLACSFVVLAGNKPEYPVVDGFVFFDNEPLSNADVFFVPNEPGATAKSFIGRANECGFYTMPDGVPPGDYRVVVRGMIEHSNDTTTATEEAAEVDDMQHLMMTEARSSRDARPARRRGHRNVSEKTKRGIETLPEVYSSAAYTILRVRISDQDVEPTDLYLWSDLCEVIASSIPTGRVIR